MSSPFNKLASALALGVAALGAHATVLTFEDRPDLDSIANVFLSTYQGFNFGDNDPATNPWLSDNMYFPTHSGTHFAATDPTLYAPLDLTSPGPLYAAQPITALAPIDFEGAWFSGYGQVRYDLYLDGELKSSSLASPDLSYDGSIFVASGYSGPVDQIVVFGYQGWYAMDDFTYTPTDTSVPEPTSLALVLLAGTVGAGLVRRRTGARPAAFA